VRGAEVRAVQHTNPSVVGAIVHRLTVAGLPLEGSRAPVAASTSTPSRAATSPGRSSSGEALAAPSGLASIRTVGLEPLLGLGSRA
jgi:hypothetical protein